MIEEHLSHDIVDFVKARDLPFPHQYNYPQNYQGFHSLMFNLSHDTCWYFEIALGFYGQLQTSLNRQVGDMSNTAKIDGLVDLSEVPQATRYLNTA